MNGSDSGNLHGDEEKFKYIRVFSANAHTTSTEGAFPVKMRVILPLNAATFILLLLASWPNSPFQSMHGNVLRISRTGYDGGTDTLHGGKQRDTYWIWKPHKALILSKNRMKHK